ncbi:MAG: S-layer protein domain-containing protein [Candidatus Methanoperedens sp.]|nr:S-layer protein domain-containing protein [Candidatus Methanoperedens sp.]
MEKKIIKIIAIFALSFILAMPANASNVTTVEIHGVVFDEKSKTYNTTLQWDAQKFPGFWYNFNGGKSGETLTITQPASSLTFSSRTILANNLFYNTSRTDQNYTVFTDKGLTVENGLSYSSSTGFTKGSTGGKYAQLGWFGNRYVAVNGKANKLAKLVYEQDRRDKKTLKLGETWNFGEGYNLTVDALDTGVSPRQASLTLSKDGKVFDTKVVHEGEVYTYVEKNLQGESDFPLFVTYVNGIFTGAEGMASVVQLRYTWLISQNVFEVKVGDQFGVFEVKEANENYLLLYNKDRQIDLSQNSVSPLYGDLKFKIADKDDSLRFYPVLQKTTPGKYELHGVVFDEKSKTYNTTLQWDAQKFPGFWYNFNGGKSGETLTITQPASSLKFSSRTILKNNLFYNTSRTDQNYTVFTDKGLTVENGLSYSSSKGFTKGSTGGKYAQLGWFGNRYVAVNGKANKMAKLIYEQDRRDKKTLKLGETWNFGEGYNLTVDALDTGVSPRQASLTLSKDGKTVDTKVVHEGEVYTYVEKNLQGESDFPLFVTYVNGIFTGAEGMSAVVQLRYTWLISENVLEVKGGDQFGVFEVKDANENYLLLYNKDKQIDLSQNSVQPLYSDLKFKIADKDDALRFYPFVEQTIQATSTLGLKAATPPVSTSAPAIASTAVATQVPSSASIQAGAVTAVQSDSPVKTATENAPLKGLLGFWGFYAVLGISGAAYFVLRKKD